jgi:hypothetical protein
LAALAGLAKGPQGPLYFAATVTVFLCLRRDWRYLFSLAHLAGLIIFAAVLGAWQIPFGLAVGREASAAVWSEEGTLGNRFAGIFGRTWWRHLATYPAEVFAYLLPWSVFLLAAFRGSGVFFHVGVGGDRAASGRPADMEKDSRPLRVGFLLVYLAVAFPTCWLVTEARPRHLMAVYPTVACLIAAVIDRSCFGRSGPQWDWRFRWFLTATGAVAAVVGAVVLIAGVCPASARMAEVLPPSWSTAACGAAMLVLASVCFWARAGSGPTRAAGGIAAVGAAISLGFVILAINHFARIADDLEAQVARLKRDVLRGQRLVSFGPLFHKFTFYYQEPIELLPWPAGESPEGSTWQYFAFMDREARARGQVPFAWEEVAVVYCDRAREKGHNVLHVGRRRSGKLPDSSKADAQGGWEAAPRIAATCCS